MRRWRTLLPPPKALRQRHVRFDNIALVPGSLLPDLAAYQALANQLPQGEVLVVLPAAEGPGVRLLETAARSFRARGRHVRLIRARTSLRIEPKSKP